MQLKQSKNNPNLNRLDGYIYIYGTPNGWIRKTAYEQ